MYYFQAIVDLIDFKSYILDNLGKEISFGNMKYYYILDSDYYLKIYEVDLDEFDIPAPKWKGCFGTNISVLIKDWKGE